MSDRLVCERNTNVDFIDHFRDDFYQIKSAELVRSIKWQHSDRCSKNHIPLEIEF